MPAKKVKSTVKLVIQAGKANPAPPIGSSLGPLGINLMQFCQEFNAKTASMSGSIPVLITVYEDRSFEFIIKTPFVSELIKQYCKISSGSKATGKVKVASLTMDQVREIAEKKMADLNCYTLEAAIKQVIGTSKSMGVTIFS